MIAITRAVSPKLGECELSFQNREPIDVAPRHGTTRCISRGPRRPGRETSSVYLRSMTNPIVCRRRSPYSPSTKSPSSRAWEPKRGAASPPSLAEAVSGYRETALPRSARHTRRRRRHAHRQNTLRRPLAPYQRRGHSTARALRRTLRILGESRRSARLLASQERLHVHSAKTPSWRIASGSTWTPSVVCDSSTSPSPTPPTHCASARQS